MTESKIHITKHKKRYLIAGGGTGGHIFPAVAIADALKQQQPDTELLFVGAAGRMEMEKVPQAGYKIVGLEVVGLQRSFTLKNLKFPFKLLMSLIQAFRVVIHFKPDACIGVGGYASGPVLFMGRLLGKKIYIQEQNSYPGITNKILAKFASKIFVAYDNLHQFFNPNKIIQTGNPVRKDITTTLPNKKEACNFFQLSTDKKTILIIGGSLGAKTINESIEKNLLQFQQNNLQIIWQTGKVYYDGIIERTKNIDLSSIKIQQFIREMNMAYAAADIVVSRAGALSISELCIIGKPSILIPSPNVSEDHQTKNAMALVTKNAAILIKDVEAKDTIDTTILNLLQDETKLIELANNIKTLAKSNAATEIVTAILQDINH
ncbi:MAG TPA: undecaprenyldiphospho-muramoylpentapeptide beta-N-acetylglucosaminyltransferase [Chitinophagales bacterium]|nr:undecaprenyldiphospho-muramoylpentapeptide beta-N-acetylglucosaminyltransferase [Chitinophagales bacterium]HQW78699.1 undecaprenyldiphospho-muramoylpentapeptide beta-N-acetylglucosaminyltransferase [Chitinophagales bacterium]HRB18503.1 undecaprenyldiphospho-muramoylpentapeptide beta-N-acetylglucosaminyltransferase [Chitinophagales bacterium]HRB66294.1 undecaprenyldiphospho-muramoylpentapeptide beta-N-acetylglucosaminyltransferase [Chitinophagales bacterium]HRB68463.1 undecaprenyldiphospho-mu